MHLGQRSNTPPSRSTVGRIPGVYAPGVDIADVAAAATVQYHREVPQSPKTSHHMILGCSAVGRRRLDSSYTTGLTRSRTSCGQRQCAYKMEDRKSA